jgi:hypothetical protein
VALYLHTSIFLHGVLYLTLPGWLCSENYEETVFSPALYEELRSGELTHPRLGFILIFMFGQINFHAVFVY